MYGGILSLTYFHLYHYCHGGNVLGNHDDGRPTTTGECECSKGGSLFPICKRIKGPREGDILEDYK